MECKKIYYGQFIAFGCLMVIRTMISPTTAFSNKSLIQVTGELQIPRSVFTLVNTILQGLGILLSLVVSVRLVRGNMKRIRTVSIIGFVLPHASLSLATSAIHLYISSFFTGIFLLNASLIPVNVVITNWFIKKRGLAIGMVMAGIDTGGTILNPVITWLLGAYGWRSAYRTMAPIILVLALPVALFILRKCPEDTGPLSYGSEDAAIQGTVSRRILREADIASPFSVEESRVKLFLILFIFGMLCSGLINAGSLGHFPPAIEEFQGPQIQALAISTYPVIGIFGKLVLGWLNDKSGVVVSITFGRVTFAFPFIFILFGRNISILYIMVSLSDSGGAIGTVTPPLITSAIFGVEKYSEIYEIVNSLIQIGLSLRALMVAAVYDTSGSYSTAWTLLIILTLGAFAGWVGTYAVFRKYRQKSVADNA